MSKILLASLYLTKINKDQLCLEQLAVNFFGFNNKRKKQ